MISRLHKFFEIIQNFNKSVIINSLQNDAVLLQKDVDHFLQTIVFPSKRLK